MRGSVAVATAARVLGMREMAPSLVSFPLAVVAINRSGEVGSWAFFLA